jgi:uncharacterized membrane protein YdbT with pleckstrin-like domain
VPYPDRVLLEDEEVLSHFHPHWRTVVRPVVCLLAVVGGASYCAAAVPAGPRQDLFRLVVLGLAVVLLLWLVAGPVLRWGTTHSVLTTSRLLLREGVLIRRGRDIAYARISEVAFRQTLVERLLRSGTVVVHQFGDPEPVVLRHVPGSERVQRLLQHLVDAAGPAGAREAEERAGIGWAPASCDGSVTARLGGPVGGLT